MRFRMPACVLFALLTLSLDAAAADVYDAINALRAGAGGCAPASLPPLQPQAALELTAQDLARGADPKQGFKQAGYRPVRWRMLSIKGAGVGVQDLAKQGYCAQLQDASLTDVGVFLDARQFWVVLAAPFAPSVAMPAPAAGQRVLELVNRARAVPRSCGNQAFKAAPPLRWNQKLAEASRLHAEDMAHRNYFSHDSWDGSKLAQRVERAGYRYRAIGENIAAGASMQPENAVAGWIKSPPHCANLMNPVFTEMGAAFGVDAGSAMGIYWAQAFGAPR
jgi:uncharacterized protein YkwD